MDRLLSRTSQDGLTSWIYGYDNDGNLIEESNLATNTTRAYIWFNGQQLARVDGVIGSNSNKYFFENDHLGSPLVVTDNTGKVVWNGDHSPFGLQFAGDNNDPSFDDGLRFTGKDWDKDVELYYFNARWYDSETGRFVSEDSYKGDPNEPLELNYYDYCTYNPLSYNDPTGHEKNVVSVESKGSDRQVMGNMATITEGDTLWGLAEKYYGNGEFASIIALANGLTIDKNGVCNLQIDNTIYIPAIKGKNTPDFKYGFGLLDYKQYKNVTSRYQHSTNNDSIYIETEYSQGGAVATNDELYLMPFIGTSYRYGVGLTALVQGAIDTAVGEAVGTGINEITNALPNSGRFARIIQEKYLKSGKLSGGDEAFVTAPEDIAGITSAKALSKRLALLDSSGKLIKGPFAVVEFNIPELEGVASPVFRTYKGFVQGGLTKGGAREWVILNRNISELEEVTIRILK